MGMARSTVFQERKLPAQNTLTWSASIRIAVRKVPTHSSHSFMVPLTKRVVNESSSAHQASQRVLHDRERQHYASDNEGGASPGHRGDPLLEQKDAQEHRDHEAHLVDWSDLRHRP